MKRPMTLSREIESIQAKIAERRRDRARIDDEISHLMAINRAKMMALVGATVERWDLGEMPVQTLMLSLSKVTEDALYKPTSLAVAATVQVFVRFGRNASASNLAKLEAAGLHWNGREGGWVGIVAEAQISDLRQTFGGRLEKPDSVRAEDDPGVPPGDAEEQLSSDVEPIVTPSENAQWPATTASGRLPTLAGFPLRRLPVT